ncbi:cysteine hydrolase family protein [Calditerrivibrio sp.]|jgi:nicotinamidase-related amidase|uniref:cysteine hydrolase family protein n=1 Tax=Calditerrivibrio sp. TaxID=2792612 RepID=UPI003D14B85B
MKKIIFALMPLILSGFLYAADIIDEWDWVVPPEKPGLLDYIVDNETALLILDIEELTCNKDRRPRCLESVPNIEKIIKKARSNGVFVVYSLTPNGTKDTILLPVKPIDGEPIVNSSVNKFLNTELDKVLKDRNIRKLIITGTAANGAVLFTATEAAQRGYLIVIPVDGISADLYGEQAVIYTLLNGPGTRNKVLLTKTNMIKF